MTLTRIKEVTYSSEIIVQSLNQIVFSGKSNISAQIMAHNTSPTLDKQTCTDYVDFGHFSGTKNNSIYLEIKLELFKRKNKDTEFRLRKNFTMGEADFYQSIRQKNLKAAAADNFLRKQNLSSVF